MNTLNQHGSRFTIYDFAHMDMFFTDKFYLALGEKQLETKLPAFEV